MCTIPNSAKFLCNFMFVEYYARELPRCVGGIRLRRFVHAAWCRAQPLAVYRQNVLQQGDDLAG